MELTKKEMYGDMTDEEIRNAEEQREGDEFDSETRHEV